MQKWKQPDIVGCRDELHVDLGFLTICILQLKVRSIRFMHIQCIISLHPNSDMLLHKCFVFFCIGLHAQYKLLIICVLI